MSRSEGATIVRHASTVLVGQLAVMAFGITDTLVAGRFADTALPWLIPGGQAQRVDAHSNHTSSV
jgi:multidrug resistance protein, MATE family